MEAMKTIEETRRDRLAMLEQEFGSQVHLAELIGKSPVQISQWKNASKYSGSEKRRAMDSGTARLIEDKTGKPRGWMDQPLQRYQPQSGDVALRAQETADPYGYVRFELLSVSAAAGRGLTAQMPEVLSHLLVDESWARRTFGERISRVHLITARGTSMRPTSSPRPPLPTGSVAASAGRLPDRSVASGLRLSGQGRKTLPHVIRILTAA